MQKYNLLVGPGVKYSLAAPLSRTAGPRSCNLGQAASFKPQASSSKHLTRLPSYSIVGSKQKGRTQLSTRIKQYNGLLELDEKLNKVEIEINETTTQSLFFRRLLLEIINRMDSETN
jgi:hypothetical protein